ncbi:MAG TPA: hypothetical protein VLX92_15735 [Kofleriaceae bacterium]|nr:hypothetical protein [Kofleriaceae bacterium]
MGTHDRRLQVAFCSIVLGGCTGLASMMPHASTSTASSSADTGASGAEQSTTPDASGLSPKEKWWRKVQEDSANAKGAWDTGGNADDGHMKRSHQAFAQNCGHELKVLFDWKTFNMAEWVDFQQKQHRPDDVVGGFCAYQTIEDLASACAADSPLKPYQRDAIKNLRTLTCHARPCKDMPDTNTGEPGSQELMSFAVLSIANGGTNLDMTFCESAANGDYVVNTWMRSL